MRANPKDDWTISDVQSLCRGFDITCEKPDGTSHFTVSDATQDQILTVVAARPILPIYIKKLVAFVDEVQLARAAKEAEDGD
ncbi:MAG: type II toxin-antitoxin system HicA family toxin [Croceibacterium sp.]